MPLSKSAAEVGFSEEGELGLFVHYLRGGQDLACEAIGNYLCDLRRFAASRLVEGAAARAFTDGDVQPMCNRSKRNGPNDNRTTP